MAQYYAIAETERQGRMRAYDEWRYWQRLNRSLRLSKPQTSLTNSSTSDFRYEEYTRGAFLLAALDAKIRAETYGQKSLIDVFYRLNMMSEVNHTTFRRVVVDVGGRDMGPWVDRYIAGTDVPQAPKAPLEAYVERIPHERGLQAIAGLLAIGLLVVLGLLVGLLKR